MVCSFCYSNGIATVVNNAISPDVGIFARPSRHTGEGLVRSVSPSQEILARSPQICETWHMAGLWQAPIVQSSQDDAEPPRRLQKNRYLARAPGEA
jgi:hypothetical protein